ncbi:MAG: DEAD/DEAH box helicase [Blastocatellia bacterium]
MTSEVPPLERIIAYLHLLEALRGRRETIPTGEFVVLLGNLPADTVRDDFVAMGIVWSIRKPLDIQSTYWTVGKYVDEAERNARETGNLQLELPTEAEILKALPLGQKGKTAPDASGALGAEAAEMIDIAFECLTRLELSLLGHGRMSAGEIAFPHQLRTAKSVSEEMHGVAIVADEVGLGKTNVAGLIIEEVLTHDRNASILILVPANLRNQWAKTELPKYFGRTVLSEARELAAVAKAPIVLLALDTAKGNGKGDALSSILLNRVWDLLIVDEAHECRNADSLRFKFVYSLQARRRVFLTATPLHNSVYDIFNLTTLLKPGCLGQRRVFAENYMDGERTLQDTDALQQTIRPMMTRSLRSKTGIPFAKRKLVLVEIKAFKVEETQLYDELLDILQSVYRRHTGAAAEINSPSGAMRHVSQFVLISMLVLREMASHPLAAIETLKTALRKRVKEFAEMTHDDSDLEKLDRFIESYAAQSWDAAHHAKSERLLDEAERLFKARKKFVIYVNYRKTHQVVIRTLAKRHPDARILSYEGSLKRSEKDWAIKTFEETRKACLVSTDSGGQGLNLQFANCVLNYDFPWNPMRIEQRIGRVDRVKQQSKQINVLNFRTRGTVEEYVQIVLTAKLKECRSVLGEFTSPLQIEKVYEDKLTMGIGRALMEARNADDMRKRMMELGVADLERYIGDYALYEREAPPEWTYRPRD